MDMEQNFDAVAEEDIEEAKSTLRAKVRAKRKQLTNAQRTEAAAGILRAATPLLERAHTLAAYVPVNSEPDIMAVVDAAWAAQKKILLPRLGPKLSRTWALYRGREDLQVHAPGRPPAPSGEVLDPRAITQEKVLFIPALSIDRSGNRLGQGGGWYDHVLENAAPDACICGIVYNHEYADAEDVLPTAGHDKKVNAVITPAGLLYLN